MDNRFTCPCGRVYRIVEEGRGEMRRGFFARLFGRGEFQASRPWQAHVAQPTTMPQAVARPPVQHDPAMTRWVRLPLAQAVVCGFFAAWLPTAIAIVIIIVTKVDGWWWAVVPAVFAFSIMLLSGVAWYILFVLDRKTLMFIERFIGVDLNRDGVIGEPKTTIVDFTDREKRHKYKVELPVTDGVMTEIAHAMLQSGGRYNFSRRDMMAKTSISDDAFDKLQKEFLRRGWATYRKEGKPNAGVVLLAAGRAVLRGYL